MAIEYTGIEDYWIYQKYNSSCVAFKKFVVTLRESVKRINRLNFPNWVETVVGTNLNMPMAGSIGS